MKKLISILLILILSVSLLSGCGTAQSSSAPASSSSPESSTQNSSSSEEVKDDVTIRIGGLKGATSIGMVKLMSDSDEGFCKNNYDFTVAGSADEITPLFIKGELDVIAGPVNLASNLYNKTEGAVRFLAINTLGVLYIVQKSTEVTDETGKVTEEAAPAITSVVDLKGHTIYATGKGSTPEYNLRYILKENGLDPDKDVIIEWKSEPTETVALMAEDANAVAMLPQPYVTVAQTKIPELTVALDLTEEWEKLDTTSALVTAGLFVRAGFLEEHPEAIKTLLEEYKASTDFANSNVADAAKLCEQFDIIKAPIAEKAIPLCNITCITGADMKDKLSGYLSVLFEESSASVGGELPLDNFYYEN